MLEVMAFIGACVVFLFFPFITFTTVLLMLLTHNQLGCFSFFLMAVALVLDIIRNLANS